MLVVNYNGNKPVNDYFKYSVQGNNNADIVRFVLLKKQGRIDLSNENYHIYAKCQTPDGDFADKIMLTSGSVDGNNFIVDWTLLAKHTQFKQLQVSLSFEDLDNEVVWQTQLFTLTICNGVQADEEVENSYPSVLQDLQAQIDELRRGGGGSGGAGSTVVRKIYLKRDSNSIATSGYIGYIQNDDYYFNNPSTCFIVMETTPISSADEVDIRNGQFVIRLDYPTKRRKRGFSNFINNPKLLDAIIFVSQNDIYTNAYGEKYVKIEISLKELFERLYVITRGENNNYETQDWVIGEQALTDLLVIEHGGFPTPSPAVENQPNYARGSLKSPLYKSDFYKRTIIKKNYTDLKRCIYTPIKCYNSSALPSGTNIFVYSRFCRFNRKGRKNCEYATASSILRYAYLKKLVDYRLYRTFLSWCSLKPTCAVIASNYQSITQRGNIWLKTYPHPQQTILARLSAIYKYEPNTHYIVPILRVKISDIK